MTPFIVAVDASSPVEARSSFVIHHGLRDGRVSNAIVPATDQTRSATMMQDADEIVCQTLVLVARIEAEMALTRDVRLKATCLHILICALYVHVTLHEFGVRIQQGKRKRKNKTREKT